MRVLEVKLPEREGQAARTIVVAFTHPWKKLKFRGEDQHVKVTTCSVGEKIAAKDGDAKQRYKFYGFDEVKWPLIAPVELGKVQKGFSINRLPGEPLSKTNGAKAALKRLLAHDKLKTAFNYDERTLIWKTFHRVMRTGVIEVDSQGQPPALVAVTSTAVEQPVAEAAPVLMLATPIYGREPAGWMTSGSKYVH